MNEPIIKQSVILKNIYTNSLFIWVSTSDGHNWVNSNCPKFGKLEKNTEDDNSYRLIVSMLYEFEDVCTYLCQELGVLNDYTQVDIDL